MVAVLLSFVLTRYVRNTAVARGWVSEPSSERHLHSQALPRLGGIAIFFAFVASLGIASLVGWWNPKLGGHFTPQTLLSLLLPGTMVFLLGLYDDIYGASPYIKFGVQALAACVLFAFGLQVFDLPILFHGQRHLFPWFISLPLTILWVLAITNAFNLIDGLDGLAAGSAFFSTLVVLVVALTGRHPVEILLTLLLAGTILGFLRFNFNPATIFLGDSGSLFIGFMLSALALTGSQKSPTIVAVAIPVVSFGLPILETALSVLRRFIGGRPVFTADREHIHHKLLQLGLSHRQVVVLLYAVSAGFGLLSLFLLWPSGSTMGLIFCVVGTGIWFGVQHLGYLEFGELRRVAQRTMETRLIFINNLAIRRATEELKVSVSYEQICRILVAAFKTNDFDGFHLYANSLPEEHPRLDGLSLFLTAEGNPCLRWRKHGTRLMLPETVAWSLTLDLVAGDNRRWGWMRIYRGYADRDLQLDINLLTSRFPRVLADAMDRHLNAVAPAADTGKPSELCAPQLS